MPRPLVFLLLFLALNSVRAQSYVAFIPDSTKEKVKHLGREERLDSLLHIATLYKKTEGLESSIQLCKAVLEEAEKLNNDSLIASALYQIGSDYEDLGFYRIAISHFNKALKNPSIKDHPEMQGMLYNALGISLDFLGKYTEALQAYLHADSLFEKGGDWVGHGHVLNNIGLIYFNQKNYKDAEAHFLDVWELAVLKDDPDMKALAASNLGMMNQDKGDFEKALEYYLLTLEIDLQTSPPDPIYIGSDYNSLGEIWSAKNNFDSAYAYFQLGLNFKKVGQALRAITSTYLQLAELHLKFKKEAICKLYLDSAYTNSLVIQDPQVTLEYLRISAEYYKATGNATMQARNLQEYIDLQDSLTTAQNYELTKSLEEEYRLELREKDLTNLRDELDHQKNELKNFEFFLIILAVLAIALIWLLVLNRKKNVRLRSQQKELENALQAKTRFLSVVSHEVRTPLHVIIGLAENLLENCENEEQKKSVTVLHDSAHQLIHLVNDVLDLNKLEHGSTHLKVSEFSFHKMLSTLAEAYAMQCSGKGLDFYLAKEGNLPDQLIGDRIKIEQVLNNLLNNAVKFTDEGSIRLEISLEEESDDTVQLGFLVQDSGIGIPEKDQNKIFNPFYQSDGSTQRNFGGTGLGLSISKGIVELMGGEMHLEKSDNSGTSIYFKVACQRGISSTPNPVKTNMDWKWPKEKQILVAEDHEQNRMLLKMLLDKIGAQAVWTSNGAECLTAANQLKPDLVLLDMHMPILDGYETAEALREQYGNTIHIIGLTAADAEEVRREARDYFDDLLFKPYTKEELFNLLKKLI